MRSVTASISTSSRVHPREDRERACSRSAATRPRRARRARGCCARRRMSGFGSTARRSPTTSALTAASSSRSRPARARRDEPCSAMRSAPELPGLFASTTPSSTTCTPGLQTRSCTRPRPDAFRCCLEPDLRLAPRSPASLPRTDPRALADRIQEVGDMSPTARATVGRRLRERSLRPTR